MHKKFANSSKSCSTEFLDTAISKKYLYEILEALSIFQMRKWFGNHLDFLANSTLSVTVSVVFRCAVSTAMCIMSVLTSTLHYTNSSALNMVLLSIKHSSPLIKHNKSMLYKSMFRVCLCASCLLGILHSCFCVESYGLRCIHLSVDWKYRCQYLSSKNITHIYWALLNIQHV